MEHIKTVTGNAAAGIFAAIVLTGAAYALWLGAPLLNSTVDHVFASDIPVIRLGHAPVELPAVPADYSAGAARSAGFSVRSAAQKSVASSARTYSVSTSKASPAKPKARTVTASPKTVVAAEKPRPAEAPKVETPKVEQHATSSEVKTTHESTTARTSNESAVSVKAAEKHEDH
jgi:hypothetical protein